MAMRSTVAVGTASTNGCSAIVAATATATVGTTTTATTKRRAMARRSLAMSLTRGTSKCAAHQRKQQNNRKVSH